MYHDMLLYGADVLGMCFRLFALLLLLLLVLPYFRGSAVWETLGGVVCLDFCSSGFGGLHGNNGV